MIQEAQAAIGLQGPIGYENWRAKLAGHKAVVAEEFDLYSDARIVGEAAVELGPYHLIADVPHDGAKGVSRILRLRVDTHTPFSPPNFDATDTSRYHGLMIPDEIACLVSLCLGIKLKRGGGRYLQLEDGSPLAEDETSPPPVLEVTGKSPIVPRLLGGRGLENLSLLATYPRLAAGDAVALVRAARHFCNATWVAEGEPEFAWLFLVSAVETAAHHNATDDVPAPELLWTFKHSLAELLQARGGDELVAAVADQLAHVLGATKKFRTFLRTFLPAAPDLRPDEVLQQDWRWKKLEGPLNAVYGARSTALHAGVPVPLPMSVPPFLQPGQSVPAEVPLGGGMSALGAVWDSKDVPMLLNTFFYIVQGALLNWWQSLVDDVKDGDA